MIFSGGLCEKVLDGSKTVTRRPARIGVMYGAFGHTFKPCQYKVGHDYAVQPGRGKRAVGRIRVLSVDLVSVGSITRADARNEGFKSADEFYEKWRDLYGHVSGHAWRIAFELVETAERESVAAGVAA